MLQQSFDDIGFLRSLEKYRKVFVRFPAGKVEKKIF